MQLELDVSVCIATYRRPTSLARLLESLARQVGDLPSFEVLIVDNDTLGSAAPVSEAFEARLPMHYFLEPEPGISAARNRAVASSRGRYLAFVDDDHEVGPDWLSSLFTAAVASGADGVFAPVHVRIEGELPSWVRDVQFFNYSTIAASAPVPWYQTRTGNSCVRRQALPGNAPFNVALGLIGGEDVELFSRMIQQGARLIEVPSPAIEEHRPAARADAAWLIRRSFRNGGTFAHVEWGHLGSLARARRAARSILDAARHLLSAPFRLRQSRTAAFASILRSAQALGEAAWVMGFVYAEYGRKA